MYVFDCEVFKHDWLFVFQNMDKGHENDIVVIHNDNEAVKAFMENSPWLCGFNNKHYDNYILKAVLKDASPAEIKELSDYIIAGGMGWEYPLIASKPRYYFDSFDLMDDMQQGLSLKAIEAHLGMNIEESQVDFNIDRLLTEEELAETIFYCKYDVAATVELLHLRKDYLRNKLTLGRAKGLSDARALYMTNAGLTAAYLDAKPKEHNDRREYVYPTNLLKEYIPKEVFDFFDRLHDKSIPDDVIFSDNAYYDFKIGECECRIAFGGIHGAIPCYREKATNTRSIRNKDVASYYPHEMTIDGYLSRNIPDPSIYADMLEERMKAKKNGDKAKANALKLVANTTYGATLREGNALYDPLMGLSVCITGQLRLLELSYHLTQDCPTLKIIQLNTDGIMVSLDDEDIPTYNAICDEWQQRTGFELEEDCISEIIQKDVNNYIEIPVEGDLKLKGGVLVRGIPPAGAFNINNNATIVAKAIVDYFVNDIPVEKTIGGCNDILAFQIISKVSSKYIGCYHIVNGEKVKVQRVNRVYATNDYDYGTLIKIHAVKNNDNKIPNLPTHCVVDNKNQLAIGDIDKTWYVRLARRYIRDFLGIVVKKPNGRKAKKIMQNILKFLEDSKNGK